MARKAKVLYSSTSFVTYENGCYSAKIDGVICSSPDRDAFNTLLNKFGYKGVRLTKNLMNPSAGYIVIDADTPLSCNVGSETYWSM